MSIESRVVPGISETIVRGCPSSALSSDDLPTFGRPRIATPISSPRRSTRSAPSMPRSVSTIEVEQVAGADAVQRRQRQGLAEAELVELERLGIAAWIVELVRDQDHRLARAAQQVGELLVPGSDAGARVDHEQHEIGLGDRGASLVGDLALHRARVAGIDATGVEDREGGPAPLDDQLLAVARDARLLVHDRLAGRGQAVHERRLADVREADDGDRADQGAEALRLAADLLRARWAPGRLPRRSLRDRRPRTLAAARPRSSTARSAAAA